MAFFKKSFERLAEISARPWFFFALFIAAVAQFNSGVANLRIQPVQSLDAPELALYQTLRRVEEHERAGVLVATNIKVVRRLLAGASNIVTLPLAPGTTSQQPRTKEGSCCFDLNRPRGNGALLRS